MIHKFAAGHAQYGENPELRALLFRIASLAKLPIHAIFVADGPHRPKLKRGKQVKTTPLWLTVGLRNLVDAFGFGWIEAAGEAEAELAHMNKLGLIDAVMTDDSDALIFGARVIIRKYFRRHGPDDVQVYRASTIHRKFKLGRDELFLFALLVGCDYDQAGLLKCGTQTAHGLVKYGLGRALRQALDTRSGDDLTDFLHCWREDVRQRLREDPLGHIGRRSLAVAAQVTGAFPNVAAARHIIAPALLPDGAYTAALHPHPINFAKVGAACELYFTWGNRTEILDTFRSTLWPAEVARMLICEGNERAGIQSLVRRYSRMVIYSC
ncbi:PIN domain-like protein [Earliella scabrosa]|nr:PIN domain-like protein [Earliella scabrosa]